MDRKSLNDIFVTPLKKIKTYGGDVMHALKSSDNGFHAFGEAYFSWINEGFIKAWKCHQIMTLNIIVPLGEIRFVFYLPDHKTNFRVEDIGEMRYVRLTVPPGIWFGFKGKAAGKSLLLNIADIVHEPNEVLSKPKSEILYDWT